MSDEHIKECKKIFAVNNLSSNIDQIISKYIMR
jgi:hypothetical protein